MTNLPEVGTTNENNDQVVNEGSLSSTYGIERLKRFVTMLERYAEEQGVISFSAEGNR